MKLKKFTGPLILLIGIVVIYYQFFFLGKIPIPSDLLVGAYFPWLDYNWGYPAGVPVKNPPITDVISQLYLWRVLAVDLIKSGSWPLWNPYSSSGAPLLANLQSAPFLPFNILLFLPKYFGWGIYVFSQTAVAALGMYLLLTRYKLGRISKIAGALVFCLSGLMSTYVEFVMAVFAASSIVWVFFAVESFWQTKKIRYLVLLTISFSFLYLSGHAQLGLYGTTLFLAYLGYNLLFKRAEHNKLLILPTIFWILAVGIAALQLFPTLDYLSGDSIRGSESYSRLYNFGLAPLYELIKIAAADFFGNPATYNYWGFFYYHDVSLFLGTITLAFIIPLIFKRFRDNLINFWGMIFILSLLLGFDNPLSHAIYSLPIPLLTNSSASRIFFITSLSGAILLAFSLNKYYLDNEFYQPLRRSTLLVLSLLFLVLTSCAIAILGLGFFSISDTTLGHLIVSLRNSVIPVSILCLLALTLRFINNKKIVASFVVVILLFDLGRYFLKHNPFVDANLIYPSTPVIDFLQSRKDHFRIARADGEIMPPNTWIAYGLSSAEGYDPLSIERYSRFINRSNGGSFSVGVSRYIEVKNYPTKFLDALGVKYFLAVKRDKEGKVKGDFLNKKLELSGFKKVFEDKNSVVLENPNAKDKAYFVNKVDWVVSDEKLESLIDSVNFDPTKEAVVEGIGEDMTFPVTGNVEIIDYKVNDVTMKTETDGMRFMILADAFDKGWNLYENGQKQDLYRVNGVLRGILVKGGVNRYQLKYWPNSFDAGLKVTLLSLLVLTLVISYTIFKKRW